MAKVKATYASEESKSLRPALTEEAREIQMISLATNLAEKQLREGTASSQVISHYLKLGTARERLERERLAEENKLLRAKTEVMQAQKNSDEMYAAALKAIRDYSGNGSEDDYDEDYDEEYDDY